MVFKTSQTTPWFNALTLEERIALISYFQENRSTIRLDLESGLKRKQKWQSQPPFDNSIHFDQWLRTNNITEQEFLYILSAPVEALQQNLPEHPTWLQSIENAFTYTNSSDSLALPDSLKARQTSVFLNLVKPLIAEGAEAFNQGLQSLKQTHSHLPFSQAVVEDFFLSTLGDSLLRIMSRTLVLELNVFRLQGQLQGDIPEERFQSFAERIQQPDIALSILQEYPVLARQVEIAIERWVSFCLEFLNHLCQDWDKIQSTFSPDRSIGQLIGIEGDAGDSHRGGRCVMIAKFDNGLNLVYKPRSLSIDVHFQELLTWLNERGNHPPFQPLTVLDCGFHGWVEFVSTTSCSTEEEIQRFYERQGGYLALLYALEATDFHSENLIASGEHPVLVDLETLFHPTIENRNLFPADELAHHRMAYSVLSVGLLPYRTWTNEESESVDISGIGSTEGQMTPYGVSYWAENGTDRMHLDRKPMEIPADQNRPTLKGNEVNPLDYTEQLVAGFANIYRLLLTHRDQLLAQNGPLAQFAGDEVRVILRNTRTYETLLNESYHPDLLRNALERDRFFDRLWSGIEFSPEIARAIPAEHKDLENDDIPIFTTHPLSRDLWSSTNQRIPNFLSESGMNLVHRRLKELSDRDLEQQSWFIQGSLATLSEDIEKGRIGFPIVEPQSIYDHSQYLSAARSIGDRLEWLALQHQDHANWIGLTILGDDAHFALAPLWIELYDGLAGVVLFLAYLGKLTNEARYARLAQAGLKTIRCHLARGKELTPSIGAFNGWSGIVYLLAHLSQLWGEPELLNEAQELVPLISTLIESDEELDIISGCAGCIAGLLSLYRVQPNEATLTAAIQCGTRLVEQARPMQEGVGWMQKCTDNQALSGFSHGAAGMAAVLLELYGVTGEERFYQTAVEAIRYERTLFYPKLGNWLDLREPITVAEPQNPERHSCMTAWCHGAPGIGLARLRSLPYLDTFAVRAEINTAIRATLDRGFGYNHSLCHGSLGNLELLLTASQTLNDKHCQTQLDRLASIILESIENQGWICGVPMGVETPGLMTGLAGIGYGLLRYSSPEAVPSVLMLEPPRLNLTLHRVSDSISLEDTSHLYDAAR
jgi:type 2 lantibiotic biosynthesis protein LanM